MNYKAITATSQVKVGAGKLKGILVSSTSSGTVTVYDSAQKSSSDPTIIATITPAANTNHQFPDGIFFNSGLYVVIANTASVTVMFD